MFEYRMPQKAEVKQVKRGDQIITEMRCPACHHPQLLASTTTPGAYYCPACKTDGIEKP